MDFKTSKTLYSSARISKYVHACSDDKRQAMQLYRYYLRLCQRFFGVLHLFEVILRNAINNHYSTQLADNNWIINQATNGKLLSDDEEMIKDTEAGFRKHGVYSNDKMIAAFTMGFWTFLFTKKNYKKGGKTLLRIFPNKAKGKNQADVYNFSSKITQNLVHFYIK